MRFFSKSDTCIRAKSCYMSYISLGLGTSSSCTYSDPFKLKPCFSICIADLFNRIVVDWCGRNIIVGVYELLKDAALTNQAGHCLQLLAYRSTWSNAWNEKIGLCGQGAQNQRVTYIHKYIIWNAEFLPIKAQNGKFYCMYSSTSISELKDQMWLCLFHISCSCLFCQSTNKILHNRTFFVFSL